MERRQKRRSRKASFPCSTLAFSFAAVLIAMVLYTTDKGPPLPPWDKTFKSIDCHSVELESYNDRGGFIDLTFRSSPSVEYPPEYLPHFLSLEIETPPTIMRYSGDQITNITRTENHIQFSVIHTWAGPSTIKSRCLNNPGLVLTADLKDITNWIPEYSRSDHPSFDHAKFRDVCLEYEKFLYFVQVKGDRPAVPFDGESLRFEMLKWPLEAYLKHKNVSMTHRECFLVAPLEKIAWKMTLGTLIPLAASVDKHAKSEKTKPLFVFRKQIPENAAALNVLGPCDTVKLQDIMCFDMLVMTSTYSSLTPERIESALRAGAQSLQKLGKSENSQELTSIVIADNLWDAVEYQIKERLPHVRRERLDVGEENIERVREKVRRAKVLIGDHISSLINMVWLSKGATVIDATPEEYACNPWAANMAKELGIGYKAMFAKPECVCGTFSCYPMKTEPGRSRDFDAVVEEAVKIVSV